MAETNILAKFTQLTRLSLWSYLKASGVYYVSFTGHGRLSYS